MNSSFLENLVYHFFWQLWLVLGVKLMEINSNLFSRLFGLFVVIFSWSPFDVSRKKKQVIRRSAEGLAGHLFELLRTQRWLWFLPFAWGWGVASYLEVHPSGCKWLGSPPFISHEVRPFGRGSTLLMGLTNHGYWPLTNWDDPPSREVMCVFLIFFC